MMKRNNILIVGGGIMTYSLLKFVEGFSFYLTIITLSGLKGKISFLKIFFLSILHGTFFCILNEITSFQVSSCIVFILSVFISSLVLELDFVLALLSSFISVIIFSSADFIAGLSTLTILNMPSNEFLENYFIRAIYISILQISLLVLAIMLYIKNINLPKKFFLNRQTSMLISSLSALIFIFSGLGFIVSTYVEHFQPIIYVFLGVVFICFLFIIYKLNQYIVSMAVKEVELENQNIYIEYIKELINNLKSQRHEFVNHINVLYGIIQFKDLNHLDTAKKYIENLNITIHKTSNIMMTDEPIVSGLLFTKTATAEQKKIEMDIHIIDKITDTMMSYTDISTVLNNLINNAIEFSETLPEENRYICIEIIGDENNIYLNVCNENNGQPITNTDIIFKKGFSTKTNVQDSRGFGLYNIKSIIEKNHGSIEVESNLQETTFKIILPKKKLNVKLTS